MRRRLFGLAAGLAVALALAAGAGAAGELAVGWYSLDGGGGQSSGGVYALQGTAGQHDAGVLSGGAFTLAGGFWPGAGGGGLVYLPVTTR